MCTRDGGKPEPRDVHGYKEPQGPSSIGNKGPGLGGTKHGSNQTHHASKGSGKPGLGGSKHPSGSQRC